VEIPEPNSDKRDWFGGGIHLFCFGDAMDFLEEARYKQILNAEEEYNKFLKSEDALIKLLSFYYCNSFCVVCSKTLPIETTEPRTRRI